MSDETERPEEVDELISTAAEKWGYNEGTIEDTLENLGIDPDEVSAEKATEAKEAFEDEDEDAFVGVLKDISETPEMVDAFRDRFLSGSSDEGGDGETSTVETPDPPDTPDVDVEADEDERWEQVQQLTDVVKQQGEAIQQLNSQLKQATEGAQQQQAQPAPQQQGGGGGMLGNMGKDEMELLKMVGDIVRTNREPNPWAEKMQQMQETMFEAQMNQLQAQTGETPGQKLGRKFDSQLAEKALDDMDITFSGGSGDGED